MNRNSGQREAELEGKGELERHYRGRWPLSDNKFRLIDLK